MSSMKQKSTVTYNPNIVEIKAKFECEFRRFSVDRTQVTHYEMLQSLVTEFHCLPEAMHVTVSYTDPRNGDLLPINNDDNLQRAFTTAMPLLKLFIYREQESMLKDMTLKQRKNRSKVFSGGDSKERQLAKAGISAPQGCVKISSIVDADVLPDTIRRVRLVKHSSDLRLGIFIRDGTCVRVTPYGLEKVAGIFISRLASGGLAEGTGLLGVNDEIIEVNGIEVRGKMLDQVTDMMVANSQNLIITVKPAALPPSTPKSAMQGSSKSKTAKQVGNVHGASNAPLSMSVKNKPQGELVQSSKYTSRSQGDLPSASSSTPPPSPRERPQTSSPTSIPSNSSTLIQSNTVNSSNSHSQPEAVDF